MGSCSVRLLLLLAVAAAGAHGKSMVSFMKTAMTVIKTPNNLTDPMTTLKVNDRNLFIFSVKACNDVHLYLQGRVGEDILKTEVHIGGWRNSRSAVRIFPEGGEGVLDSVQDTPGILSCHEMRTFWLSWKHQRILVGRGPMYGQQTFLDFNQTAHGYVHDVNVIYLATGNGASGLWQFRENQVDSLVVDTDGYEVLWKTSEGEYNVTFFEVRACHTALIAMSPYAGLVGRSAYEIVIGGWDNTRSVIKDSLGDGPPVATLNLAGLLDCNRFKPFWIGWGNDTINFGKGYTYNEEELLRWQVPDGRSWPIRSLGFSTFDGVQGTWIFHENTEPTIVFNTPMDPEFNQTFVVVPRQTHLRFWVQACSTALLYMSPNPNPVSTEIIYIGLGFNGNRRYHIKMKDVTYAEADYEDYLDCDRLVMFWISWNDGLIKLGSGEIINHDATIQWQSPYPVIYSVGLRSPQSQAYWRIRSDQVDNVGVVTEPADFNERPRTLIWADEELIKVLSVRGCSDASVVLLNSDAWEDNRAIEVTIGADNNQKVKIVQAQEGGDDELAEVSAPGLLSCDESRIFWISWVGFTITVGRGWRYGQSTIISTPIIGRYNIQALTVRGAADTLTWHFPGDSGDYVLRKTFGDLRYEWMRPRGVRKWMNFWVRACSSIAVVLSSESSLEPSLLYTIGLDWGTGSLTYIKKDGSNKVNMTNLQTRLDCTTPRPFWVSWNNATIALGSGNVPGFEELIKWTDMEPCDIRSIGITSGESQSAEWKFRSDDLIESTSIINPGVGPTQFWATVRHRQSLQLKIKTCEDFRISLTTILGMDEPSFSYTLELGTNDGSMLRTRGRVEVKTPSPNIFKCDEEREMWLSWGNGVIMVGEGFQFGRRMFLNFSDIGSIAIHAIGFASNGDQPARVRMLHDEVEFPPAEPSGSGALNIGLIAGVAGAVGGLLVVKQCIRPIYIIYQLIKRARKKIKSRLATLSDVRNSSQGIPNPLHEDKL